MCSLNEEDLDVMPEVQTSNETLSETCRKCNAVGSIVLRKKDVYCTNCFSIAINHKFRASLGKNKTIQANQKVAVALSGGLASSMLLNLVYNGLNEDSHKQLRVDAVCIYINEDLWEVESIKNHKFILEKATQHKLPLFVAHISSALEDNLPVLQPNSGLIINTVLLEKFKSLLKGLSTSTSKIDLLTKMRRKLILRCAKQLQCSFILSGETSTTLASNMLSNLTLGRGSQIENDISFCDSRDLIRILKPIREVTQEELNYYANLKNISYCPNKDFPSDSIQATIGKFVVDLQENFPATVSTICKTGEKIGNGEDSSNNSEDMCIICQSVLDTQEVNSSALQATNFSRLVSSTGPNNSAQEQPAVKSVCDNCNCSKNEIVQKDIECFLCYGCRLIVRDIKDAKILDYFNNIATTKMAMVKLRSEINDFLL